ncbi:hypothetical protein MA16_Dca008155 [Dendrobium catenatum]|uniref:Uncharacterized protein n=1 Tax=Dendrobium catenatum TaxID=906689 RepID=A0A2I0XA11_9ASPA|nr:hypothetical protein MA16_Dca008155 [Dendrobium catenatum]
MEGLIPFVIHAFKKNRSRATYRCLSDGSSGGGLSTKPMMDWAAQDGSSHHRRARSEMILAPTSADLRFFTGDSLPAPSLSFRQAGEQNFFGPVAEIPARRA